MIENASAPEPSYSLVAIDIDGTLIHEASPLSDANGDAVRLALASGVRIVLASGKSWPGVSPVVEALGLPGPHIVVNGTQIVGLDGCDTELPPGVPEAAEAAARRLDVPWCIYLAQGVLVVSESAVDDLLSAGEPRNILRTEPVAGRALKVLFCVPEGDERVEESLRWEIADPRCAFVRTSARFLEVVPRGANKGTALRRVADAMSVAPGACLAIGDAENDVPMFEVAGLAVATTSASESAKRAADLVVPASEHPDAVAWALRSFALRGPA